LCHLYYYHDGLAIYNRAVESLVWIEDVVDDLSRTRNNHDASTIRRKKERTYRELEKEYKQRLLRAKEDRVADDIPVAHRLTHRPPTTYPPRIYLDYSNNFNIF
jgi:hypothetical protein